MTALHEIIKKINGIIKMIKHMAYRTNTIAPGAALDEVQTGDNCVEVV